MGKNADKFQITILIDNNPGSSGLLSEHGLAVWIEAYNQHILFDAGQSDMLLHNASKMGVDLTLTDILVLSHGHYDHTGGVAKILELNPAIKVFCHPNIFKHHYSRHADGKMRYIGINKSTHESLSRINQRINWLTQPFQLNNFSGITGPIPRETVFEDTGGDFYFDLEGNCLDPLTDDLAIYFKTSQGIIIVTGCCHSGLVNTCEYILKITLQNRIHSITGGFHLLGASIDRMEKTIEYFKHKSIESLIPLHCTGKRAVDALSDGLGEIVIEGHVGTKLSFNL